MQRATYWLLYADEHGESHFDEVALTLEAVDFAPPAPPLNFLKLFSATGVALLGGPAAWRGDTPHPSPRRQLLCTMQGSYAVTASDGETREFPAGSLLLVSDTTGKGHATQVLTEETLVLVVTLD